MPDDDPRSEEPVIPARKAKGRPKKTTPVTERARKYPKKESFLCEFKFRTLSRTCVDFRKALQEQRRLCCRGPEAEACSGSLSDAVVLVVQQLKTLCADLEEEILASETVDEKGISHFMYGPKRPAVAESPAADAAAKHERKHILPDVEETLRRSKCARLDLNAALKRSEATASHVPDLEEKHGEVRTLLRESRHVEEILHHYLLEIEEVDDLGERHEYVSKLLREGRHVEEHLQQCVREIEEANTYLALAGPQVSESKDVSQNLQLQLENEQKECEAAKSQLVKMRHEMGALNSRVCQLSRQLEDAQRELQESRLSCDNLRAELECEQKTLHYAEAEFLRKEQELELTSQHVTDAQAPPHQPPEGKLVDEGDEVHQKLLAAQAQIASLETALQELREGGLHGVTEIEGSGTCPHCTKPQPVERKDVSQTPQLQPENEQRECEDAKSQLQKMRHEMSALLPLVCQLKKKLVDAQTQLQESCNTNANLGSELECEQKTFRIMEAQFLREKEELQRAVADARSLSRQNVPTPPRPTPELKHGDKGEEVHQVLLAAQAKITSLEMALQEQEITESGTRPPSNKPQSVEIKDVSQTLQLQLENEQRECQAAKSQLLKLRHEMGALHPVVCQLKKKLVATQTELQESRNTNANLCSELVCEQKTFRIMEAAFQRERQELQRAVADARSPSRQNVPTPPRPTPELKLGDEGDEVHQRLFAAQAKITSLEMALQEKEDATLRSFLEQVAEAPREAPGSGVSESRTLVPPSCKVEAFHESPSLKAMQLAVCEELPNPMVLTQIMPNLLLGEELAAHDRELLDRESITHLLCCFQSHEEPHGRQCISLHIEDEPYYPVLQHIDQVVNFLRSMDRRSRCLIYCRSGVNRSPTIAIALLMQERMRRHPEVLGEDLLRKAFLDVSHRHGRVLTNFGFQRQLLLYAQNQCQWSYDWGPELWLLSSDEHRDRAMCLRRSIQKAVETAEIIPEASEETAKRKSVRGYTCKIIDDWMRAQQISAAHSVYR